jgi:branched-chain amino acid transport system substrate-binding protein
VVKQGGKSWFFLTADYAFGHALEPTPPTSSAGGGKVVGGQAPAGRLRLPSCCRRRLQGPDPRPGQRRRHHQLHQGGQRIRHHQDHEAGGPADVHQRRPQLGLKNTEGLYLTDSWYWDQRRDPRLRQALLRQAQEDADLLQAADYSAALHYLKAVKATGPTMPTRSWQL